jgi:hypothetical protein
MTECEIEIGFWTATQNLWFTLFVAPSYAEALSGTSSPAVQHRTNVYTPTDSSQLAQRFEA